MLEGRYPARYLRCFGPEELECRLRRTSASGESESRRRLIFFWVNTPTKTMKTRVLKRFPIIAALGLCAIATLSAQQPWSSKVNPKDGQTYVWIPPGDFMMGCSVGDTQCYNDEKLPHSVRIPKGFWLGQKPVTQAAYLRVIGTNPSSFKGFNLPVENVTWHDAKQYCSAIGGRLPKETEWEYAARAGSKRDRPGDLDDIAWYVGNSNQQTHPVGRKQPNAWGLYDMLGNVWQWTADWYGPYSAAGEDGEGPTGGDVKVLRGGSWMNFPRNVRVSIRSWYVPSYHFDYVGFRCVAEYPN